MIIQTRLKLNYTNLNPLKNKTKRRNYGGFANKELRKAWCTKSRLRNIYNRNKTDYNWQNFKKQRNLCTSLKRKAKLDFYMEKTKSQQSFWKIFGPYLSNKGHHSQEDYVLLNDGNLMKDKKYDANTFNEYYVNIIEKTTGEKIETFQHNSECDVIEQIIEKYKNHHSISLITEKLKGDANGKCLYISNTTLSRN